MQLRGSCLAAPPHISHPVELARASGLPIFLFKLLLLSPVPGGQGSTVGGSQAAPAAVSVTAKEGLPLQCTHFARGSCMHGEGVLG